jgi:toluene monooxygenase system protein E
LSEAGRHNGDTLLGLLCDAQLQDAQRHRRWAGALVKMCLEKEGNLAVLNGWVNKWQPLAQKAIEAYCAALPDVPTHAQRATHATQEWRRSLGLSA